MSDGLWFRTEAGSEVVTVVELAHQEAVCQQLSKHPVVTIDTEGQNAEVISLLAPAKDGNYIYLLHNLPVSRNLQKLLVNHNVLKVGWALDNDIRILEGRCGRVMRPIIDVQSMLVPFMGYTNLDAAASQCLNDSKPYGRKFAGSVNWAEPFLSSDDDRLDYCTKDVELIFKLWEHHNSQNVTDSLPDSIQLLDPKESYCHYLPVDFSQYQTFEAAANAVMCCDLLKENNRNVWHGAAASLTSIYWNPPINPAVQAHVNWLLGNAAASMNRYNSVESLSNYIFFTAWSFQQAQTDWPDKASHHLYIQPNNNVVQYLLRDYSQRDMPFYNPYSVPCYNYAPCNNYQNSPCYEQSNSYQDSPCYEQCNNYQESISEDDSDDW